MEVKPPRKSSKEVAATVEMRASGTEMNWLRTLSQDGMTIDRAMTFLRLACGFGQEALADNADISKEKLRRNEKGRQTPQFRNINKFIEAVGLKKNSKPAQLVRLKKEGILPMTHDQLRTFDIGDIVKYLRVVKGLTQNELAIKLGIKRPALTTFEKTSRIRDREAVMNKFIAWLRLSTKSVYTAIIRQKIHSEQTTDDINYWEALKGPYLLAPHIQKLEDYPLTETDERILAGMEDMLTTRDMVSHLYRLLDEKVRQTKAVKKLLENTYNGFIPKDINLVKFAQLRGYDIHHPIVWLLLNTAHEERIRKQQSRSAERTEKIFELV